MGDLNVSRLTNPVRRSDWKIVAKRRKNVALRNTLITLLPLVVVLLCCLGDWASSP